MPEEIMQEETVEAWSRDADGNLTKIEIVWHNQVAPATIEFYVVTSK